ncbi:hypothetical protein QVD17_29247 [Tagetes erecta]|uniref:Uncharacterized protein n=1 Tax=Tagetes erecta TaxID=13708 RepID=A0AAD8KBZ2_TARER|nr:hypothetical protein QVD17_29247 [Tagetes erecta]
MVSLQASVAMTEFGLVLLCKESEGKGRWMISWHVVQTEVVEARVEVQKLKEKIVRLHEEKETERLEKESKELKNLL